MRIKRYLTFVSTMLACVFCMSIAPNSFSFLTAYADTEPDIYETTLNFVENNLDIFETEYNNMVSTEKQLQIESIEYSRIVYVIEDEANGIYLDFNDDKGYAVISTDLRIFGVENSGDYEVLKEIEELHYSCIDGFLYKNVNGKYNKVFEENAVSYLQCPVSNENSEETIIPDGEIDEDLLNEYISLYMSGFLPITYETAVTLPRENFDIERQLDNSYYIMRECDRIGNVIDERFYWSEGNCALHAMYSLMKHWSKEGQIGELDYSSTVDLSSSIVNDPLYEEWGTRIILPGNTNQILINHSQTSNSSKYYFWETNTSNRLANIPQLYANIRDIAVRDFYYTPETGFYTHHVPNLMETVASSRYGLTIDVIHTSTVSDAISSINSNKAVYLSINNSTTYGNHAVVLLGYQLCSFVVDVGFFQPTMYFYFYLIADGWDNRPKYFNPNTTASPILSFCILN